MKRKFYAAMVFCLLCCSVSIPYSSASSIDELTTVNLQTHFFEIDRPQINIVRFTADQGPIIIVPSNIKVTNAIRMTIIDPINEEEVFQTEQSDMHIREFTLPRTGEYDLYMEYVFKGDLSKTDPVHIRLQARRLQIPEMDTPRLALRRFQAFEMIQEPFDLGIRTLLGLAEDVQVYLDDQYIADAVPNEPFMIDPSHLEDGFHHVMVTVKKHAASLNESLLLREFVVDNLDTFLDVPLSHWGHKTVEVMNHLGIVEGRGNERFEPDQPVSRQEFAKIFAETLGLEPAEELTSHYEDITVERWSKPYIDALTNAGLIEGVEKDGRWYFHPERTISRAEAATIIGRTALFADVPVYGNEASYVDFNDVPDWAGLSVMRLSGAGWLNGYSDGTFRPSQTLTRAEASKLVGKFLGL